MRRYCKANIEKGRGSFYFTAQAFIKVIWHESVYKANAYIYNPKTLSICKFDFHHFTDGIHKALQENSLAF